MLTQKSSRQVNGMPDNTIDDDPNHLSTTPSEAVHDSSHLESEFLAVISHELRSPLTAIKGFATTLRRHGHKLGRIERDEFLQAIDEASDRLEVTISRLMELARLETGMLTAQLAPVDVVHLVKEAIMSADNRWKSNSTIHDEYTFISPEQETMPMALADLRLQRDVLDIVLENAVKYSPGGGVVRVTLQLEDSMIVIGIHDRGIGIPPEHLHRIFARFHRVDNRLTREVEGAGLGLAICKRIMELQGGAIWAESEPEVGSSFYMTLPLAQPRDEYTA